METDEGKYKQNCVRKVVYVVYYYLLGLEDERLEHRKKVIKRLAELDPGWRKTIHYHCRSFGAYGVLYPIPPVGGPTVRGFSPTRPKNLAQVGQWNDTC